MPAAAKAALCITTECFRLSGLPIRTTRCVTRSRRPCDREVEVGDDLVDPVLELRRIGRHRMEHEVLHAGVDARLERGDDLVWRAEEVDGLEVLRPALARHDLQEGGVLLLAGLLWVLGQDEMHEVLMRDDALARVATV